MLGYADDLALVDEDAERMTKRFTKITDKSKEEADMEVNVDKTYTQHVHKRAEISVTAEEVVAMEAGYTQMRLLYPAL